MDFVSFKRAKFEFLPNLISWNVNFGRNCQDNHHEIAQFTKIWQTLLRNSLCCTSKVLVSKFSWSFTRFQQQNYIILEIWLLKLTIFPINFKVSASSNQKIGFHGKKVGLTVLLEPTDKIEFNSVKNAFQNNHFLNFELVMERVSCFLTRKRLLLFFVYFSSHAADDGEIETSWIIQKADFNNWIGRYYRFCEQNESVSCCVLTQQFSPYNLRQFAKLYLEEWRFWVFQNVMLGNHFFGQFWQTYFTFFSSVIKNHVISMNILAQPNLFLNNQQFLVAKVNK